MRPHKRPAARKKNVRNAHKKPEKLGGEFPDMREQINKYGYYPSENELWSDSWLNPPLDAQTPENYVRLKKAQHLAYVPKGSILFVKTLDNVFNWNHEMTLYPTPVSRTWKIFVRRSPTWEARTSRHTIIKRDQFGMIQSTAPTPVMKEFVCGYIYFEALRRGYRQSPRAEGTYMFGGLPPLLFCWEQCMVGEDTLLAIVSSIKHGKEIYEEELKKLGIYDEAKSK